MLSVRQHNCRRLLPAGPLNIHFTVEPKGLLFYDSVCPSFSFSVWCPIFPGGGCGFAVCQRNVSLDGPGQLY